MLFAILFQITLKAQDNGRAVVNFEGSFSLFSKVIFRGIPLGESPAVGADLKYHFSDALDLGFKGTATIDGSPYLYGNSTQFILNWNINKKISLAIDDYFYFGPGFNDFLYQENEFTGNGHFDELQFKYEHDKIKFLCAYVFFATKNGIYYYKSPIDIKNNGVWFETHYDFGKGFGGKIGYLTAQSHLAFTDKGGINVVALDYIYKKFGIDFKTEIVCNPNYKHNINNQTLNGRAVVNSPFAFSMIITF